MSHNSGQTYDVDESTLLNFYELKTLSPSDYRQDSTRSNSSLITELGDDSDLSHIPRERFHQLLTDRFDEKDQTKMKSSNNATDPLGFHRSLVDELIDKDIIDDSRDPKKFKFLIDSKSFNAKLFLSMVHKDKPYKDLEKSVIYLERSLKAEKPKLQNLISTNFQKVIDNKKLLDEIYDEYSVSDLTKSVDSLNLSVNTANTSSTLLLNPVIGDLETVDEVTSMMKLVTENSVLLDLPKKLDQLIVENDFNSILNEYEKGKRIHQQANSKAPTKDTLILNKIWNEVEEIMNVYKKNLWEKLGKIHIENINLSFNNQLNEDNFLTSITRILELGSDENPIIEFINLQYDYILKDIDEGVCHVQLIRYLKCRLHVLNAYNKSNSTKETSNTALKYIFSVLSNTSEVSLNQNKSELNDLPLIIELWGFLISYVSELTDEILRKKILKFASIVEYFSNDLAKKIPLRSNSKINSAKFLKLEDYQIKKFGEIFETLIGKICNRLTFLMGSTNDELTKSIDYYSNNKEPMMGDTKSVNSLDSFGFIPLDSNTISNLNFSIALQSTIAKNFENVRTIRLLNTNSILMALDNTLLSVNSNIINGILCTLIKDSKKLNDVENWQLSANFQGCTKLPEFVLHFYELFIPRLKKLIIHDIDKESFKSIQSALVESFQILLDSQLQNIYLLAQKNENSKDFYFITTLANLSTLKAIVIPKVLKLFDSNFRSSLSTSGLSIFSELENAEVKIYKEYLTSYKMKLTDIISTGIRSIDWFTFHFTNRNSSPSTPSSASSGIPNVEIPISPFILKSINFINLTKSKLFNLKLSLNYIRNIESDLINHFILKLIEHLKLIQQFNSDGLYQISIDLRFLLLIFEHYAKVNSTKSIDLSQLSNVSNKFMKKNIKHNDQIDDVVRRNLHDNKAQMDSFGF